MPEAFDSDAFDLDAFDSDAFEVGTTTVGSRPIQSSQQMQFRSYGGTATAWNGDFVKVMADDLGDSDGGYNSLLVRWLQQKLSSSTTSLPSLLAEAAADRGVSRWQEIENPTAIGT